MGHSWDNKNQQASTSGNNKSAFIPRWAVSYQVKVRIRGEKQRSRTFKRKTDAKLWAAKIETDLSHGAYVPTTADRRRTLADLIDAYKADYLPYKRNNKDAHKQAALLAWWRDTSQSIS